MLPLSTNTTQLEIDYRDFDLDTQTVEQVKRDCNLTLCFFCGYTKNRKKICVEVSLEGQKKVQKCLASSTLDPLKNVIVQLNFSA